MAAGEEALGCSSPCRAGDGGGVPSGAAVMRSRSDACAWKQLPRKQ